jgi:hypothetical protein
MGHTFHFLPPPQMSFSINTKDVMTFSIIIDNQIIYYTIKTFGKALAYVFFHNKSIDERIIINDDIILPAPIEFYIVDDTHKKKLSSFDEKYFLCYTDNYTFYYKDRVLLRLTNQRGWDLLEN